MRRSFVCSHRFNNEGLKNTWGSIFLTLYSDSLEQAAGRFTNLSSVGSVVQKFLSLVKKIILIKDCLQSLTLHLTYGWCVHRAQAVLVQRQIGMRTLLYNIRAKLQKSYF